MATAEPDIGISFPPVATAEQRQFTIDALRPLGITHIRFAENWRRRGMMPDFGPLERRVSQMRRAGFDILLTVQSDGPDAACIARNAHSCLIAPDAPFEAYLTGLLSAVGDDLDAIQFGNEWDNQFVGTVDEFLALHARFAQTVRHHRPDLTIVMGGVTGRAAYHHALCLQGGKVVIAGIDTTAVTTAFCIDQAARNLAVSRDVTAALMAADYDVADLHLYDAETLWPAAVTWFAGLTDGRPVWLTEFGGPTPSLEPDDPDYQAARLRSYLDVVLDLRVARAYYFKLTDDDGSIHARSGLYDRRGRPKPALDVFADMLGRR